MSPGKCHLFKASVKYLGFIVSAAGVSPDPEKVSAVRDWIAPTNIKEVRSFLGFASYYRKHIRDFARVARPLHKLTGKGVPFHWDPEQEHAFTDLKNLLLAYPDPSIPFIVDCDASNEAIGSVLSQIIEGEERVIAYYAKALSKPERNYCVTRKELLAVVNTLKHFHVYLMGANFTVRSDHSSLRWLLHFKDAQGQIARWLQT